MQNIEEKPPLILRAVIWFLPPVNFITICTILMLISSIAKASGHPLNPIAVADAIALPVFFSPLAYLAILVCKYSWVLKRSLLILFAWCVIWECLGLTSGALTASLQRAAGRQIDPATGQWQ